MQAILVGKLLKVEPSSFDDAAGDAISYLDISILQEPDFVVRASGSVKKLPEPWPIGEAIRATVFVSAKTTKAGAPALKVQVQAIESLASAKLNGASREQVKVT